MRKIYVVSFSPSHNSPNGVGGFDWYKNRKDAILGLIKQATTHDYEGYNYSFVELEVPETLDHDGITTYIDNNLDAIEPAGVIG